MLKSLLYRLIRSRRVYFAFFGHGAVSLANLFLSIAIARVSAVTTFSEFSLAMVAYLFSTGLIKSAFTNTALSRPDDRDALSRSLRRSSLASLVLAVALFVWGIAGDNSFLVLLGVSLHGLLILDFHRTYDAAAGKASRSFAVTAAWSFPSIVVSLTSLFLSFDPLVVFATWSCVGALNGYISVLSAHLNILPSWPRNKDDTNTSVLFAGDYLVGAGGAQLTTGLLGFLGDGRILGAVRGAGTLLGPINLISTTARSLILPFLARSDGESKRQLRAAAAVVMVQMVVVVPLLIAIQFIPDNLGTEILGETWRLASLAILPLSIDALFNVIMAPAIAGHRVALAGGRTLIIRIFIGIPRPFVVLFCGFTWGISGAAWAMALIAIASSIIWWISYIDLSGRTIRSGAVLPRKL